MVLQCYLCGGPDLLEFLNLGKQPLANKYPVESQFSSEEFFPLSIYFCPQCKNVQLGTFISRDRMFEDYYYLSSVNPGLVRHFEALANKLASASFVVDVGSNDGILLKPLAERGVKALGVEPSRNVSKIAIDAGLPTICSFFDMEVVNKIRANHGVPDVIVASSVFTHLENPHSFIEAAKALLASDGRLIIEVEYIGNILETIQFERFYLDRIFYYSLSSLRALFASHQMSITEAEHIEPHGGSLRVTIQNGLDRTIHSESFEKIIESENVSLAPGNLQAFRKNVDTQIEAFRGMLKKFKDEELRVAGYGAPARLSTICNYGRIGPPLIDFTVDDSPLKQNKFTPGTHIPIVPKQHLDRSRPDVLIVFAYEYLDDIRKKTGGSYRYFVPIPPREIR